MYVLISWLNVIIVVVDLRKKSNVIEIKWIWFNSLFYSLSF